MATNDVYRDAMLMWTEDGKDVVSMCYRHIIHNTQMT